MTMENKTIEKIRASYEDKEVTKFDELKSLDKKVKTPAKAVAYTYGGVGSLVLGTGMCLAMGVLGGGAAFSMPVGICIGLVGIAMAATAYPLYQAILKKRKQKYAKQILELSDSLLNR